MPTFDEIWEIMPEPIKYLENKEDAGKWFHIGQVEAAKKPQVSPSNLNALLNAVETMVIALDMAQAFIRNEKLERDIVLKEIDMALENNPIEMESI